MLVINIVGIKGGIMLNLSRLNELQQNVAAELDKNIFLIASAGTGKTNTLAYRIANIIDEDRAKAEEILCMTFTNKACKEMRDRIIACVGEKGLKVIVKTFHSFCFDIIKTEAKNNSDFFSDFIIFDEDDCKEVIRELNINRWPTNALQNFINLVKESRAKNDIFTDDKRADYHRAIEMIYANKKERVEKICIDAKYQSLPDMVMELEEEGTNIVCDYDEQIHEAHGLDFCDLIINAFGLFKDQEICSRWASKFKFINIDEVQDTNELEYHILSQIFAKNNLLLCGDFFQTIYEWRGSNPQIVHNKHIAKYQPKEVVFYENYRATQTLLNASFGFLSNLFKDKVLQLYPKSIMAVSKSLGESIMLKRAENIEEEAQWIYSEIRKLNVQDLSRICILTRNNNYNKTLSQQFQRIDRDFLSNPLPVMLIDDFKFFRRQEIKDVLAFMKLVVNKHDVTSLIRILKRFGAGIGEATINTIQSKEYRLAGVRLTDYLDLYTEKYGDPFGLLLNELENENVIVFDVESTGIDTTSDDIIQIAAIRLDRNGNIKEKFVRFLQPSKSVGVAALVHHITDEFLEANGEDPKQVFEEFLMFAKDSVLVGHNVSYDISILSSQLKRLGMQELEYLSYYDTLDIFRRFYPNLKNHKLEYLGEYCNVSHKSSHDAFDDICATAEILMYAVKNNIYSTLAVRKMFISKFIKTFSDVAVKIQEFRNRAKEIRPYELLGDIVKDAGVFSYYERKKEMQRIENLRNLYLQVKELDDENLTPIDAMQRILKFAALSNSELDSMLKKNPKIPIITAHQAKGSEFDYVFLAGLQECTFPCYQAVKSDEFDEEGRLFYVAITRAKKRLFLSWSQMRQGRYFSMSRFVNLIPNKYIENV